ncbi:MAG: hypothetical protein E6Q38_02510 [Crocinitomicaceae bacterium]|nr:MAG: hypothetical protein E6Q38_02510 [Crocinitomicaceae bacterium]
MNSPADAPFIIDRDYTYFSPLDLMATFLGVCIIFILAYLRKRRHRELEHYKYYLPALSFKMLFVLANAIFYIVVYGGGGDSIGYWDGAVKLNHLFWQDPFAYFREIFTNDEARSIYKSFSIETGYPDSRMYAEPESWFISKIASFFTFFTFKGYMLMSLIFAYITTNASWKLFELVRSYKLHSDWHLAIAIFFIPSLSFWCGGISKDTVVFVAIVYFLHHLFQLLSRPTKGKWKHWLIMLICLYVILQVRSFILLGISAPLLFAYSASLSKRFEKRKFEKYSIRIFFTSIIIGAFIVFFTTSLSDSFIKEASVINLDMSTNKTYGDKRYSLGEVDYSPIGMVAAAPMSILAGFYRPYIWEALNVSLILNGIESVVLLYFTFRFFVSRKIGQRIKRIRKHEFLIFAFFFAVILAYFAGFTSILFGVLVRFKAPVLPFLVIILTSYYMEERLDTSSSRQAR